MVLALVGALALAAAPVPATHVEPAWSPDGSRIAYAATRAGEVAHDLWTIAPGGGAPRRLTATRADETAPAWSPDGRWVAFTADGAHVDVVGADGRGRRRVADGAEPAWSPDGRSLAVTAGGRELRVVAVAGGAAATLAVGDRVADPAWSPDGRSIAFAMAGDLWLAAADGSGLRQLTATPEPWEEGTPSWSPDGRELAYAVYRPASTPSPNRVARLVVEAGAPVEVASVRTLDGAPAWSPDGRTLLFAALRANGGVFDLYASSDGTLRRVTDDDAWESAPAWSPAGDRIAFVVAHGSGYLASDVFTAAADGSGRRNLTGTATGVTVAAATARRLVIVSARVEAGRVPEVVYVTVHVGDGRGDDVRGAVVTVAPAAPPRRTDVHGEATLTLRVSARRGGVLSLAVHAAAPGGGAHATRLVRTRLS